MHLVNNTNARATQHYFIVKDLGQTPCAILELEAFQTRPLQRNALLDDFGARDLSSPSTIKFETVGVHPRLP